MKKGFSAICAMLDDKPSALELLKPLAKLAVKWLIASKVGMVADGTELLTKIGDFMIVSDAVDLLEETLHPLKEWPWHRKEDTKSGYKTARLANNLLVFAAYFDTIQSENRWLWNALELDEAEKAWLVNKAGHNAYATAAFSSGNQIMHLKTEQEAALLAFYVQLNAALYAFSKGLVDTEKCRADWDQYPIQAVNVYKADLHRLYAKYDLFRQWADRILWEDMAQDLADVKTVLRRMDKERVSGHALDSKDRLLCENTLCLPLSTALLDEDFLGRDQELAQLWEVFNRHKRIAVLTGLGGMGKTELAIRFGQAYAEAKCGNVYFASYIKDFRHTVTVSVASGIAGLLDQTLSEDQVYAVAVNELSKSGRNDLLILDNAEFENETFDELKRNLSTLKMRILVTTRADVTGSIRVGALKHEYLYGIFYKYGVGIPEDEMDSLIAEVEGHTLTIDLIARTMRGGHGVTTEQMMNALKAHTLPRERFRKISSSYPGSEKQARIYEHLCAIFRVADLSEHEQNVLRCAVLLPKAGLDEKMFAEAFTAEGVDAINQLLDHGWLTNKGHSVCIHPVLRMVCHEVLKPDKNACWPFLAALWNRYDKNSYHQHTIRCLAEIYGNAVRVLPEKCVSWTGLASWFYDQLGEYELGLKYNQQALSWLVDVVPHDDMYLALAYSNVGIHYGKLGNREKALEYELLALSIQEKRLSNDSPELASAYSNVAITYGELGDYRNALRYQRKALLLRKKVLSGDNLDLSTTYNHIGCLCLYLSEYEKSLKYLNKALLIRIKVLGERHPYIAESYHNIAMTYVKKHEYRTALAFERKSLEIAEDLMPHEHQFVQEPPKAIYRLEKLIAKETERRGCPEKL